MDISYRGNGLNRNTSRLIDLVIVAVLALALFWACIAAYKVAVPFFIDRSHVSVSTGMLHSAAIQSDGSLWIWGEGEYGQLGDGSQESKAVPMKIMDDVASVSLRIRYTMALQKDGTLWGWGLNNYGQLGDGDEEAGMEARPVRIMDRVAAVSAGGTHTLAIMDDATLWAWGMNDVGQLTGRAEPPDTYTPTKIMNNVIAASAGGSSSLAVRSDGALWAWGWNFFGQLGDGTTENRYRPVKVMEDVRDVFTAFGHTLAIKTDGTLWAWGSNHFGQLGDGSLEDRHNPVQIMSDVVAVTAGEMFSMALKKDGSLWVWGTESNGVLGGVAGEMPERTDNTLLFDQAFYDLIDPDPDNPIEMDEEYFRQLEEEYSVEELPAPFTTVPLKLMDNVVSVSATAFHAMAVKADGSLWSWGRNDFGQLGDGSLSEGWAGVRSEPTKIMDGVFLPGR